MKVISGTLRYLRMSPRKVRLVADLMRGMDTDEADAYLQRIAKRAAVPMRKLLRSVVASAEHDFQKKGANLFVKTVTVDKGPVLKRYRRRAFGRAADIHKHTSHVHLVLEEREGAAKKRRFIPKLEVKPKGSGEGLEELSQARQKEGSSAKEKEHRTKDQGAKKRFVDMSKRFFRRKSA